MIVNNAIYLRRRAKVVVPPGDESAPPLAPAYIAAVAKNVESLGYGFGESLVAACRRLSLAQLTALYQEVVAELKSGTRADKSWAPMYPNFPAQMMATSEAELYLNALVHYWSGGQLFPVTEKTERLPLADTPLLRLLDLGTEAEFRALFGQIVSANTSLSDQDKADVTWFVQAFGGDIGALLPDAVPQKETAAFLAGLLLAHTKNAAQTLTRFCKTATDVLRLAVALSGGDVSLAKPAKFRTFARPERRLFLTLLEAVPDVTEDMLRWKGRWIRLGEKLHAGEFAGRFPKTAAAFKVLQSNAPFITFNSAVETALAKRDVAAALAKLSSRAGELARRLDHLLRLSDETQSAVLAGFAEAAAKVSTPVLLQVRHHFAARPHPTPLRVFLPKGLVAKAHGEPNTLPPLPASVCATAVSACETALQARFALLPPLGAVYIDPELKNYVLPFALRSASKSLRTLVRGTKLPMPGGDVLRFFLWWKNGRERTDIDLSAVLLDAAFGYVDVLSYYNLKGFGGCHSGDIVDAPNGASEFIDVTLSKLVDANVRYVVMSVNSYSQQPFVELPECFAGWMARTHPESGEVYEPKTVVDRLDLAADTRVAIPVVFDVVARRAVWCDMGLRGHPNFQNNVHSNIGGVRATVQSLVEIAKPNLYDLLVLHAAARGNQVEGEAEADVVFSVANETPFRLEEIASQFMA